MSRRFRFRLQRVLGVRKIYERMAEAELGHAITRLKKEELRLENVQCARRRNLVERREELASVLQAASIHDHEAYAKMLKASEEQRRTDIALAQKNLVQKQESMIKARQKRKTLDRLYENDKAEHARLALLEEQKTFDDMVRERR